MLSFDRQRHALLVGKTGSGKSTLLRALCEEDIRAGRGLLLVDPHGDLAQEIASAIPRHRKNDLVLFNAIDVENCPGLNPFRAVSPLRRAVVVSGLLASMRKLWPDFWGPRLEHILRHAFLALMEVRGATLVDAADMLIDESRREWVLRQVSDARVQTFWTREFAGYGTKLAAEATAPILNKLGAMLASPFVRAVVTRRRPRLDAAKALVRNRIVIASLAKGQVGEDSARLLGGLLLGAFQEATMGRASVPPAARAPFQLVVDEISNFATTPFVEMMAEARKYGVGLALATQSVASMDEQIRAAILGNTGALVAFQVGGEDALLLEREFANDFGPRTLTRLGVGEVVARIGSSAPAHVTLPRLN